MKMTRYCESQELHNPDIGGGILTVFNLKTIKLA